MEIRGGRNDQTTAPVDDLFDYDAGLDEILKETQTSQQNSSSNSAAKGSKNASKDANGANLGLDEEIEVAPKRRPVAKLDEARLLSPAGIPKLRKTAKTKLNFKGKGHEYSDAMRLLNFYQLWLDDLYPRAKFADGLAMIEKLGHSKRIQIMRKEWIDEGKPRSYAREEVERRDTSEQQRASSNAGNDAHGSSSNDNGQKEGNNELFPNTTTDNNNNYDNTEPAQQEPRISAAENSQRINVDDDDDDDGNTPGNQIPSIFGGGGRIAGRRPFGDDDNDNSDDGLFVRDTNDDVPTRNTQQAGPEPEEMNWMPS
ncbi:hypothetical protein AJ79_01151 [Helicocarpus griseus UAMH5409]|uniref:Chromosome segregation in meiosis protein n=1 Tax=Helicocarpus griseus UAMH5409 TaxID=1447875 RepID=A0A2B7Y916_9EURO|nr:hypothetical protein AJ79_01151 [Helicocarpus griseus UAMH5409]